MVPHYCDIISIFIVDINDNDVKQKVTISRHPQ
jgi:hypothetical protein